MSSLLNISPSDSPVRPNFASDTDEDDGETASARSISLSSRPSTPSDQSKRLHDHFEHVLPEHDPLPSSTSAGLEGVGTVDTPKVDSGPTRSDVGVRSSLSTNSSASRTDSYSYTSSFASGSMVASPLEEVSTAKAIHYPPPPLRLDSDGVSMASISSSSSRKARPESLIIDPPEGPIVLGIGLVDFNHLVGPRVEFFDGDIFEDDHINKLLPFLALPDGAHLSSEDYSYFHLVPSSPNPTTVFGISCNRQMRADELLVKDEDVTRSIVQKAVVVLASKPVFGPIRDKLGVVTRALFEQRDFHTIDILVDFRSSLETSLRSQLTESGLYMGTNLRELVHTFRSRTLLLLKALMLSKRIMFYGHPVERLCTYQYSLVSLIPGLLQTLDDCGSPPLASRAMALSRATSLRSSDRRSLLAYLGLPLDVFGKDAFFQPYLPLQQMDMTQETRSWLCGCTNSIVTQQNQIDLLVDIEANTFEFRDPKLERIVSLTAADRKWMDEIIKDVNDTWFENDMSGPGRLLFKGSDDYLRAKFEEYISAALSSIKYADYLAKGERNNVVIQDEGGNDANAVNDFNPLWVNEFRRTNAFELWNRITDPLLFDITEARHPCSEKPNVVTDIGLRLSEGIQDLRLDQQLAPTREAISRTFQTGSTSFFKAVEGVRGRWTAQRSVTSLTQDSISSSTSSTPPVEITKSDFTETGSVNSKDDGRHSVASSMTSPTRPFSMTAAEAASETKAALSTWGTGIGSFFSQRAARFSIPKRDSTPNINDSIDSLPSTSVPQKTASSPAVLGTGPTAGDVHDVHVLENPVARPQSSGAPRPTSILSSESDINEGVAL